MPEEPRRQESAPRQIFTVLVLVLAVAACFRLYMLHEESIWYDEWVAVTNIHAPNLEMFLHDLKLKDPPMQPAYYVTLYLWSDVFGKSEVSLRLLSVALALGSLAFLTAAAHRAGGPYAALATGLALACAGPHIHMSQEIRTYPFVLFWVALSMFALLEATRRTKYSEWWWGVHLAAGNVLLATHFFAAFYLVCAGIIVLFAYRTRLSRFFLWVSAHTPGLLFTMWTVLTLDHSALTEAASWIGRLPPGPAAYIVFVNYFGSGREPFGKYELVAFLPVTMVIAAAAVVIWNARRARGKSSSAEFDAPWIRAVCLGVLVALVPPLMLYAFSEFVRPSFVMRYTLYSMNGVFLVIGLVAAKLPFAVLRASFIGLLVTFLAFGHILMGRPLRVPVREAVEVVKNAEESRQGIVVIPELYSFPIGHYLHGQGIDSVGADDLDAALTEIRRFFDAGKEKVWVIWMEPYESADPGVPEFIAKSGYRQVSDVFETEGFNKMYGMALEPKTPWRR